MPLKPDQVMQGRYRIVSLLGQGGMGAVYRAEDTRLRVPVAIKEMVPQPGIAEEELTQLRDQFEQEAVVLARLKHHHLVNVTDFFEEYGNVYLVMEFVEGESLAERIEREGAIPEEQVLAWADQLLDALAYCHNQGIIHRDIKPQNVVIQFDGQAVLVDFGLVKLWDPTDPRTRTAIRGAGTPEYAPPEQYSSISGHTGPHSDIYSLGATLYNALTGKAPPSATDRIVDPASLAKPKALFPRISETTDSAVLKAMELQPDHRFKNAQEMATALIEVDDPPSTVVSETPHAKQPPLLKTSLDHTQVLPRRQFPWRWVLVIGGTLVALGLIIASIVLGPGILSSVPMPTQTPTSTPSPTAAATITSTATPTLAFTNSPTSIPTSEPTSTPALTDTPSFTFTPTSSPTNTPAATQTPSVSGEEQPSGEPSPQPDDQEPALQTGAYYYVVVSYDEGPYSEFHDTFIYDLPGFDLAYSQEGFDIYNIYQNILFDQWQRPQTRCLSPDDQYELVVDNSTTLVEYTVASSGERNLSNYWDWGGKTLQVYCGPSFYLVLAERDVHYGTYGGERPVFGLSIGMQTYELLLARAR